MAIDHRATGSRRLSDCDCAKVSRSLHVPTAVHLDVELRDCLLFALGLMITGHLSLSTMLSSWPEHGTEVGVTRSHRPSGSVSVVLLLWCAHAIHTQRCTML